jgi:hypothetical protein
VNWLRLLEIIDMARSRIGNAEKVDRGWNWLCYCRVCAALRGLDQ